MIRGLGHLCHEERQRELWLFGHGKSRLWGDFVGAFQYRKSFQACRDGREDDDFTLKEATFRLDMNKKFLAMRAVDTRQGCPEKMWMPHP